MRSLIAAMPVLVFLGAHPSAAQSQECEDTPEGRVCRVQQPIAAGAVVDEQTQRSLGLVSVNNGCSGTLLNRYWVLTARHCVTTTGRIPDPLMPPERVSVTAPWVPDRIGRASGIHDFNVNLSATSAGQFRDIVLVYLGAADLGPVDTQRILMRGIDRGGGSVVLSGRLLETDTVTQYGQGFATFASGIFGTASAIPSGGAGIYRSAQFRPTGIGADFYTLRMNASNQVGHGGDSGGPTVLTVNGVGTGIAGVQSTCQAAGYISNTPVNQQNWTWATGINFCTYVSTEPFVMEIRDAIRERPPCTPSGYRCALAAAVAYVLE